jgi:ABC-type uncharacterized transport system ATPase component
VTVTLTRAVDSLREQLVIANARGDRAELHLEEERRRVDKLQAELAEERRRLIAILTDQRRRPWWRRWFR